MCRVTWHSLEVGQGTIEIITRPCRTLQEMQGVHETAMGRLVAATDALDYSVLGFGVQPVTPLSADFMSPRKRYTTLLQAIGDPWLLFTVTASDQVHVDVAEPELVRMINLGNLLSPVMVSNAVRQWQRQQARCARARVRPVAVGRSPA